MLLVRSCTWCFDVVLCRYSRINVFISAVPNFTGYWSCFRCLWPQANYDPYFGINSHTHTYTWFNFCKTFSKAKVHCFLQIWFNKRTHPNDRRNQQKPPCCHSWRHSWHGIFCPFRRSFGCVLLWNQIFRKQCTIRQYTTLIYLINLLWKLGLGLGLHSELHYFSIFMENKKNEHLIFCECHGR